MVFNFYLFNLKYSIFRFFEYMCSDIFGPKFDLKLINHGVKDTNTYYGGTDIEVNNYIVCIQ